jgi:hypothetical protein
MSLRSAATALVAIAAIAVGVWQLDGAAAGLAISHEWAGTIPVTIFAPTAPRAAPLVVIAHGFAGSQQLMQPFAVTLAQNGYIAVTFDFPGHGRNPAPLAGGLSDDRAASRALLNAIDQVVALGRALPGGNGGLAVLGHSMASDIVVRYALTHPEVAATVAVSLFAPPGVTADNPRNLLVIDGSLEPAMLTDEAFRLVGMAAGGSARPGVTYGSFADGTARRLALAGGVEHIGVLYSRQSMSEALGWLNQAFGHRGDGFLDRRGPWLGLLFFGLIALARPLAGLLPEAAPRPLGLGLRWRRLLPVAIAPAVLTPLILWKLPTDFLPILLGDYLVVHFALYGLLTAAGMAVAGRRQDGDAPVAGSSRAMVAAGALALAAYSIFAFGLPIDRFVTSFVPHPGRLPLILAMLAGTLPYFIADEWLTRGRTAPRGAYAATKACFVLSLAFAVALNPQKLFFLVIIVPVILAFFVIYGLFSGWAYRRTNHPLVGALANALAFAWATAVTFPVVG